MKIAIISSAGSANTQDLLRAATARSIEAAVFPAATISLDTASLQDAPFYSYDVYVFRGYNASYHQAQALAQDLTAADKLVIDHKLAEGFVPSKLHEALVYRRHGIAQPRTFFVRSARDDLLADIRLPAVVKDVDSQRGKGVRMCQTLEQLHHEVSEHGSSIIIQEYKRLTYDLRVIVIGDQVIGAIRRNVVEGDFRSNVSLGSAVEPHQLLPDEAALALEAHRALGYDISGVDIARDDDGKAFVIETNVTPEWQGFQAATDIDVADEIIRYVEKRYHERDHL